MSKPKVVLIDYTPALFSPMGNEAEVLAKVGAEWEVHQCRTEEETIAVAKDALVVVVQSVRPLLTANVIPQLTECKCMIRAGAGYDSIDVKAANEAGIMVCNAPTYCTDDVADHACALMLACNRHIPRLHNSLHHGIHDSSLSRPTRRIKGSTLGVVGIGRIGRTTAKRMSGWDMKVIAYDPYATQEQADTVGATLVTFDELLARADFVSIHCLLNDETHHLFDEEAFGKIKPGMVLVNTARGPLIDEKALMKALDAGIIWAAGLDVTEQEPLPDDSPLFGYDNIILTPHISANSPESQADLYRIVCEISSAVVQGQVPPWVVNPQVLD